jgi:hypothetical protein
MVEPVAGIVRELAVAGLSFPLRENSPRGKWGQADLTIIRTLSLSTRARCGHGPWSSVGAPHSVFSGRDAR